MFPASLLDQLLKSSAAEGWEVIEGWIEEALFDSESDGETQGALAREVGCGRAESAVSREAAAQPAAVRPEQAAAIEQLLVTWTRGFVEADVEGVQTALRGMQRLGGERPELLGACASAMLAMQEAVAARYGARVHVLQILFVEPGSIT